MVDREAILKVLRECQPCTWEDLLARLKDEGIDPGDLRGLRRIIADMIREGLIVKEPDYDRRKLVYRIAD